MERKLFFEVMAFMMLFTSCVREQSDCLPNDTRKQVTLKAGLPAGYAQVGTRALPVVPADHYLRCILEVWDETKSNLIQRHEQIYQTGDTKKGFEFNFELAEGIYQCLFWADFVDAEIGEDRTMPNVHTHYADKYYTTDGPKGLRGVSIKEGNYAVNTDLRDAFFGKYFLNKTEDAVNNPPVSSLTRPFAKLNLMEKNADKFELCNTLGVSYEIPDEFDVASATTNGMYSVDLTGIKPIGDDAEKNHILFYDYIFCPKNITLDEIEMSFEGKDGRRLNSMTIPANIPLQCNYRTNATGTLITENTSSETVVLNVDIASKWIVDTIKHRIPVWDGEIPAADPNYKYGKKPDGSYGTGKKEDPFLIVSAADLAMLSANVSGGKDYSGVYFEQTEDIDLSGGNWQAIGVPSRYFNGNYNGKGHTTKLSIHKASNKNYYVGLFGGIDHGEVRELNITGEISFAVDQIQDLRVGSLCAFGKVEKIINCKSDCNIKVIGTATRNVCIGGLVGLGGGNYSDNCYTGCMDVTDISCPELYIGGLIGKISLSQIASVTGNRVLDVMKVIGFCEIKNYSLTIDNEKAQDGQPWPLD